MHPTLGLVMTGGTLANGNVESTLDGVNFKTDHAAMDVHLRLHCQVTVS